MQARAGFRRTAIVGAIGALIVFGVIQLLPYGPVDLPNTRSEPTWDSPRTRELAVRACFDCHSNEVVWPWYAHVAPFSWLVRGDVDRGREELNFSEWGIRREKSREIAEKVNEGEMPPSLYTLVQRKAVLSDAERAELVAGLARTLGTTLGDQHGGDDD